MTTRDNCVSAACLEDDYALLGLYYQKFGRFPSRVIIETSPWVLYEDNPEARWKEMRKYREAAQELYQVINDHDLKSSTKDENPYLSLSYFQYNIHQLIDQGVSILDKEKCVRISRDEDEPADYPDGTIRYEKSSEQESEERLKIVKNTSGACTYENVQLMKKISSRKATEYEALLNYLQARGCEVILYLQPFSVTQCKYSFDQNLNPGFSITEDYLIELADKENIPVIGSFDARKFGLSDERFIDYMHLDKKGTNIVWHYK